MAADSIVYAGEFIFENGQLGKYLFEGGYATFAGGQPTFHYYTRDHLGNNRTVVSHNGSVEQVNHYYPFGAVYSDAGTNDALQRYKYNGKELDRMHGLNLYDYGARSYDPLLCRFTQTDLMAEKYYDVNPYLYCLNNPVKYLDKMGLAPGDFFKTVNEAAMDFGNFYNDNSIRLNREFSSYIFEIKDENGNKGYSYSIAEIGSEGRVTYVSEVGANNVATIHTHAAYNSELGYGNNLFSGSFDDNYIFLSSDAKRENRKQGVDIGNANLRQMDSFLVTPNGSLQKYEYKTGKILVLSNDMPSDLNDPNRLNLKDVRETNNVFGYNILLFQDKINNGILYNLIK